MSFLEWFGKLFNVQLMLKMLNGICMFNWVSIKINYSPVFCVGDEKTLKCAVEVSKELFEKTVNGTKPIEITEKRDEPTDL